MNEFETLGRLVAGYWFSGDDGEHDYFDCGDFVDTLGMWIEALRMTRETVFQEDDN